MKLGSPRLVLADLAHKELSFMAYRSTRDTRPIGSIITRLPKRKREILALLKSEDINNDILRYMIQYKFRWVPGIVFASLQEIYECETEKFDKENEKFIRQFYHSNLE